MAAQETPDADPELQTNAYWRTQMSVRRAARKLSQEKLARTVGTHQSMIFDIENGHVTSSKFILPICRALGIAPPTHLLSAEQRRWSRLGHRLQEIDPAEFSDVMALVASRVARVDGQEPPEDAPPPSEPQRTAPVVDKPTLTPPRTKSKADRTSDESPADRVDPKRR